MAKKINSPRFTLNQEDMKKWGKNALIFFAPAMILFLTSIQSGKTYEESLDLIYLWGIGVAIDLLRKFVSNN